MVIFKKRDCPLPPALAWDEWGPLVQHMTFPFTPTPINPQRPKDPIDTREEFLALVHEARTYSGSNADVQRTIKGFMNHTARNEPKSSDQTQAFVDKGVWYASVLRDDLGGDKTRWQAGNLDKATGAPVKRTAGRPAQSAEALHARMEEMRFKATTLRTFEDIENLAKEMASLASTLGRLPVSRQQDYLDHLEAQFG